MTIGVILAVLALIVSAIVWALAANSSNLASPTGSPPGSPEDDSVEGPIRKRPGDDKLLDAPAEVPVFGTSLAPILAAALDNDGDIIHFISPAYTVSLP